MLIWVPYSATQTLISWGYTGVFAKKQDGNTNLLRMAKGQHDNLNWCTRVEHQAGVCVCEGSHML